MCGHKHVRTLCPVMWCYQCSLLAVLQALQLICRRARLLRSEQSGCLCEHWVRALRACLSVQQRQTMLQPMGTSSCSCALASGSILPKCAAVSVCNTLLWLQEVNSRCAMAALERNNVQRFTLCCAGLFEHDCRCMSTHVLCIYGCAMPLCPLTPQEADNITILQAFRLVDRGPQADSAKAAAAFRHLWGERAELRRFPDGTIHEAVAWDHVAPAERHALPDMIAKHVLELHMPGCEVCSRASVPGCQSARRCQKLLLSRSA